MTANTDMKECGFTNHDHLIKILGQCDCGFVEDLGMHYGMHCEYCYNRITGEIQK